MRWLAGLLLALAAACPAAGQLEVVAGGGVGDGLPGAEVDVLPAAVAADPAGHVYVADVRTNRVRRLDAATGLVSTAAGRGPYRLMPWRQPRDADFCGDGGPATAACLVFRYFTRLAFDAEGNLFILEDTNHRVRRVDAATGIITTVAGDGSNDPDGSCITSPDGGLATETCLPHLVDLTLAPNGDPIILGGDRVRRIDLASGIIRTIAGRDDPDCEPDGDGGLAVSACLGTFWNVFSVAADGAGNVFVAAWNPSTFSDRIRRVDAVTGVIETVAGGGAGCTRPDYDTLPCVPAEHLTVAPDGTLLVNDHFAVRRVDLATGAVTRFAGSGYFDPDTDEGILCGDGGPATDACLNAVQNVAFDAAGNVYLSDYSNGRIRRIDAATGIITSVLGGRYAPCDAGGPATAACLMAVGLDLTPEGDVLIADARHQVWRLDATTQTVDVVAGSGVRGFCGDGGPARDACLDSPLDVAAGPAGEVFVADTMNSRVRRIDGSTETITTVAGNGLVGPYDARCEPAQPPLATCLGRPQGVAVDAAGALVIADTDADRVLRLAPAGSSLETLASCFLDPLRPGLSCLMRPNRVAFDDAGNVLVSDAYRNRIRRIDLPERTVTTVAGGGPGIGHDGTYGRCGENGPATAACLEFAEGAGADRDGNVFLADLNRVMRVDGATGVLEVLHFEGATDLVVARDGSIFFTDGQLVMRLVLPSASFRLERVVLRQKQGHARMRFRGTLPADDPVAAALLDAAPAEGLHIALGTGPAISGPALGDVELPTGACTAGPLHVRCRRSGAPGATLVFSRLSDGGVDVRGSVRHLEIAPVESTGPLRVRVGASGRSLAVEGTIGGARGTCSIRTRQLVCAR